MSGAARKTNSEIHSDALDDAAHVVMFIGDPTSKCLDKCDVKDEFSVTYHAHDGISVQEIAREILIDYIAIIVIELRVSRFLQDLRLLRKIRRLNTIIPIIVVTDDLDSNESNTVYKSGASDIILTYRDSCNLVNKLRVFSKIARTDYEYVKDMLDSREKLDESRELVEKKDDFIENIVRSIIDFLIVIDAKGIIKRVNLALLTSSHWNENEVVGKPMSTLITVEQDQQNIFSKSSIEKILRTGFIKEYSANLEVKKGTAIPVLLSGSIMREKGGEVLKDEDGRPFGMVFIAKDIAERQRNLVELNTANSDLEVLVEQRTSEMQKKNKELKKENRERRQAEKRAAKQLQDLEALQQKQNEFLAIVTHDLRSPLSIIKSSSELLLDGIAGKVTPDQFEFISRNHRQADQALSLVQDLLDLGKIEHSGMDLKPQTTKISELINDSLDAYLKLFHDKEVTVSVLDDDVKQTMEIDPARMAQVFNNIFSNATKFVKEGGTFTISRSIEAVSASKGSVGHKMHFCFTNSGDGIAEDKLKTMFDKYEQVKDTDQKEGTGLGLAICTQIVRLHEGHIWAESTLGKNTSIHMTIPHQLSEPMQKPRSQKEKPLVLIVDDTESVRFLTRTLLKKLKYDTAEAVNGIDGIKKMEELQPDLVLLDIEMPVLDGIRALRKIRDNKKIAHIPVIIHSARGNQKNLDDFFREADDFIFKPSTIDEFETKIHRALSNNTKRIPIEAMEGTRKRILIIDPDPKTANSVENAAGSRYEIIKAKNGIEALFIYRKFKINMIFCELYMTKMDAVEILHYLHTIDQTVPPFFIVSELNLELYRRSNDYFHITGLIEKPVESKSFKKIIDKYLNEGKNRTGTDASHS